MWVNTKHQGASSQLYATGSSNNNQTSGIIIQYHFNEDSACYTKQDYT